MTTTTAPRPREQFHTLTVAEVSRLCEDAVAVTFDVPAGLADAYAFRAGQSLTLRRCDGGREERRSYSICAPEGARPRIGVREVPDGLFSRWLVRQVRPGDEISVAVPAGRFTPGTATAGHHVLIAAGSGITPVLSIAATVLRDPAATAAVLFGNRHAGTVMFADELADLKDRYPARLELIHVLSREPREAELLTGRLDAAKLTELLPRLIDTARADHWWLCGPFGMVASASELLRGQGVAAGRIHRELFYVEDVPPPPAGTRSPPRPAPPPRRRSRWTAGPARFRWRGTPRSWRAPSGSGRTCRSRARAGCAAPAGPGSPAVRCTCGAISRWRSPRWPPASCSPASPSRSPIPSPSTTTPDPLPPCAPPP